MSTREDPERQYTDDGERENPEQMPNIADDPTELAEEEPTAPSDGDDEDPDGSGR